MIFTSWNIYSWTDPRLSWDSSIHKNIQELRFDSNQVWTPDVVPFSRKEPSLTFDNYKTIVYSNGMVLMVTEETNKVWKSCSIPIIYSILCI